MSDEPQTPKKRVRLPRLETVQKLKEKATARLNRAVALEKQILAKDEGRARKEDAHRKIILGTALIRYSRSTPAAAQAVLELLESAGLAEKDRADLEVVLAEMKWISKG